MGEEKLIEILTGLGGGAAVTTIAWYLLFTIWKRFEIANTARINELITRAESCERDRLEMRKEVALVTTRVDEIQTVQVAKLIDALNNNSHQLRIMSDKLPT